MGTRTNADTHGGRHNFAFIDDMSVSLSTTTICMDRKPVRGSKRSVVSVRANCLHQMIKTTIQSPRKSERLEQVSTLITMPGFNTANKSMSGVNIINTDTASSMREAQFHYYTLTTVPAMTPTNQVGSVHETDEDIASLDSF